MDLKVPTGTRGGAFEIKRTEVAGLSPITLSADRTGLLKAEESGKMTR
jgi:hypothetical protein